MTGLSMIRIYALSNPRGVLHLPLGLLFFFFSISLFGTWGFLRKSRHLTELQMRLDRCVGRVSLDLRKKLVSLERSNLLMKTTRDALLVDLEPLTRASLQLTLQAEYVFQQAILGSWEKRRLEWLAKQGCDSKQDLALPLPSIQMQRDPPDFLGPNALYWPRNIPQNFYIQLGTEERRSAATIKKEEAIHAISKINSTHLSEHRWKSQWAKPR